MSGRHIALLDYLIRPPQHGLRDRQAEGLGGLEVDDQFELRRLGDGQISGLGAIENLIDVGGGAPEHVRDAGSIGHEAAGVYRLPPWINRRQPTLCRKGYEASVFRKEHDAGQHGYRAHLRSSDFRESPVEIIPIPRLDELEPQCQCARGVLCSMQHVSLRTFAMGSRLRKYGDPRYPWDGLLEDFKTFTDEFRAQERQSRDIAARARKARDQSAPNRIGRGREDDWYRAGRALGGLGSGRAPGHDKSDLERQQFSCEIGKPIHLAVGRSVFDHEVPAFDIAEITQALAEGAVERGVRRGECEKPDPVYLTGLLRLRGERPGEAAR